MTMKKEYYCSCCGEKIKFSGNWKEYAYQVDGEFQCGWNCYSQEFDKRHKASKVNIYGACSNGNARGKVIDKGYERHGSR